MSHWIQCDLIQTNPKWVDDPICDTHDWGGDDEDIRKKVKERAKEYKRSREKLRSDIILAMDGPQESEALEIVRETLGDELPALSAPDYEPELNNLLAELGALHRMAFMALAEEKRRLDEDEEDVEFLLLQ